jgi:LacI family transcriptional regulator
MSTIRDIAKFANVSTATVSRVLNNDTTYKMTDETRARVWEAVTQLNYKHNKTTKTAAASSDGKAAGPIKIGCVLSVTKSKYNDPYFMSILSGIETRLTSKGYEIAFLRTGYELEEDSVLHSTFSDNVSGLILMETLDSKTYEYVKKNVQNIVGIDTKHNDIDNVGYDHYEVASMAVQHLIDKGHTKIGFIGGSGTTNNIKDSLRYRGYVAALHAAELNVNPAWVMNCQWDETLCIQLVKQLYQMTDHPTAIFVASDLMAMAALSGLYEIGVKVPQQMAVIGLSNIELSKYSNPPLTTLEIPTMEIGVVAADLLLSRLSGEDLLPRKVVLPATLILRDST